MTKEYDEATAALRNSLNEMLKKAEAAKDEDGAAKVRATLAGLDEIEKLREETSSSHESGPSQYP